MQYFSQSFKSEQMRLFEWLTLLTLHYCQKKKNNKVELSIHHFDFASLPEQLSNSVNFSRF